MQHSNAHPTQKYHYPYSAYAVGLLSDKELEIEVLKVIKEDPEEYSAAMFQLPVLVAQFGLAKTRASHIANLLQQTNKETHPSDFKGALNFFVSQMNEIKPSIERPLSTQASPPPIKKSIKSDASITTPKDEPASQQQESSKKNDSSPSVTHELACVEFTLPSDYRNKQEDPDKITNCNNTQSKKEPTVKLNTAIPPEPAANFKQELMQKKVNRRQQKEKQARTLKKMRIAVAVIIFVSCSTLLLWGTAPQLMSLFSKYIDPLQKTNGAKSQSIQQKEGITSEPQDITVSPHMDTPEKTTPTINTTKSTTRQDVELNSNKVIEKWFQLGSQKAARFFIGPKDEPERALYYLELIKQKDPNHPLAGKLLNNIADACTEWGATLKQQGKLEKAKVYFLRADIYRREAKATQLK